jgi:hypothetical protein
MLFYLLSHIALSIYEGYSINNLHKKKNCLYLFVLYQ